MKEIKLNIADKYGALSITACGLESNYCKTAVNISTYACDLNNGAHIIIDEDGKGSQKPLKRTEEITTSETEIYKAALGKWGPEAQTLMVFEEMSELQKELCKAARGRDNKEAIAEEIADVYIMLRQMILLHDCEEKVESYKTQKLERLAARITEE